MLRKKQRVQEGTRIRPTRITQGITEIILVYSLKVKGATGGFSLHSATAPRGLQPLHYRGFTTTLGRTPLDQWSARRRDQAALTRHRHSCPRRDSNPQSQQACCRRPTPYTARLLWSGKWPYSSIHSSGHYVDVTGQLHARELYHRWKSSEYGARSIPRLIWRLWRR